jgi:UDP-glucose 4-epimerase
VTLKAFVTGIAGFLGSHVAERFLKLGWDVAGIDNLAGGRLSNVPDGAEVLIVDCLDRNSYASLLDGSDVIYHCACAAYEGMSVFSPAFVYKNTTQATVEVATTAVSAGVQRFVHCSSMARYGNLKPPFREDMTPLPITPYGLAKHASELIVQNIFGMHGGTYSIAIPHSIIGPRQRFDDPYRNVVAIMVNRMLRGLQPVIYGDGEQVRCFSFVTDVLYCLEKMGTSDVAANEIFNIGPDEEATTIYQLAATIAELMNFDLDPIFVPDRPGEVKIATCSADKSRRLLGYQTQTSLREGLRRIIDWISRNGPADFDYHLDIEIKTKSTPATWTDKLI